MAKLRKIRLGDILVSQGLITEDQLGNALKEQKIRGTRLGETIIDLGYVSEDKIIDILCEQLGISYVDLRRIKLDENAVFLLNEIILKKHMLIPIGFDEKSPNVIRVAMADPMDIIAIDDVSIITNMQVEPVLSTRSQIAAQIDKFFGTKQAMAVAEQYRKEREKESESDSNEDAAYAENVDQSPIVQLVKSIMEQAVRRRASDIHIEPMEYMVRVRFRIDGSLYEVMTYDIDLMPAIVARVKIIAGMDISEKRKPQDGRISITVDRMEYDIRVSNLPTVYGEKIVMRLTSKQNLTKDKKDLGFSDEELYKFDSILKNPHGIILVTGPTGSGKSTTLYTALSELNTDDVNIITVEDPVEANVDGINQVQVNVKADLTFASALRSILRQDPDIIMIGEIRDSETAEIAVKASITGHLVVSTLHTNSTASSITRLIDMGIEPYLIGDALVGVIAQRLVRRLCDCKKPRLATKLDKELLEINPAEDITIYEPCGCEACNNTGYFGRIGVYEIMPINANLRYRIAQRTTTSDIKKIAIQDGMKTLKQNAAHYVLDGVTSISELKKIAYESE